MNDLRMSVVKREGWVVRQGQMTEAWVAERVA